jgi:hypothetical protein
VRVYTRIVIRDLVYAAVFGRPQLPNGIYGRTLVPSGLRITMFRITVFRNTRRAFEIGSPTISGFARVEKVVWSIRAKLNAAADV